ncbi:MAG: NAD(P)/FAD-dependent oxidoreductase [Luteibaculaceae bacterium]
MFSIWEHESWFKPYDVLIVGAGIVGLSAAIHLKKSNGKLQIAIIEANDFIFNASSRNAGFACFGSTGELLEDLSKMPKESVVDLVAMRWKGLSLLKKMLGPNHIGFEQTGGYEVFTASEKQIFEKNAANINQLNKLLKDTVGKKVFSAYTKSKIAQNFPDFPYVIKNQYEGKIDTGAMILRLFQSAQELGIPMFFRQKVTQYTSSLSGVNVVTDKNWNLRANKLIFCTNGFSETIIPEVKAKPARNLVLVTSPIVKLPFNAVFHYQDGYFYFRNVGNRVLVGGGRHLDFETETTTKHGINPKVEQALEQLLREKIIPNKSYTIDYKWTGILGVGENRFPVVKQLEPNVFCAVRLGGMGVAIGAYLGKKVAKLSLQS